ncbi:MAG: hypothetical protein ACREPC_01830 [Stenotrophomonas sp.]|uniref:hypothetical protein n=1 Tax=Stenotrophomonas sp. TaxID=69392 RepID=UPI003D6D4573
MSAAEALKGLREIEFHDALLGDLAFCVETRSCTLQMAIYEKEHARHRTEATLAMTSVERCFASLDFRDLLANAFAGNVQNCRVDVDRGAVRHYLCGGMLETIPGSVSLSYGRELDPVDAVDAADAVDQTPGGTMIADSFAALAGVEFMNSILLRVEVSPKQGTCTLHVQMCPTEDSLDRVAARIVLRGVVFCLVSMDMPSLALERMHGNALVCHVEEKRNIFRWYLMDGLIDVRAKSVSLIRD